MTGPLLSINWSCPICGDVLALVVEVVAADVDGDTVSMTTQTTPASTDAVYAHGEKHGIGS